MILPNNTIEALLCSTHGGPENLEFKKIQLPPLGDNQVKIKVRFVGMNFPDQLVIEGKDQYRPELPFSPCGELSGEILEIGNRVENLQIGDRVFAGGMVFGAAREVAQIHQDQVYRIPAGMSMNEAASFCCVYGTAIHCLKDRAKLQPGETIAILGASGGVGTALIQVAKTMGAKVIACASTDEKLHYCRSLGADELINYTEVNLKDELKLITQQKGVDVLCDPVGGEYSEQALRAMAWNGRYMVLGFTAGNISKIPLNLPLLKGCQIVGVFWSTFARRFPLINRKNLKEIIQWYKEGRIQVKIHDTLPMSQAINAFKAIKSRTIKGKLVLSI